MTVLHVLSMWERHQLIDRYWTNTINPEEREQLNAAAQTITTWTVEHSSQDPQILHIR
jgi:hypothetical protein